MKNWKTSLAGITGGLLLAGPQIITWYEGQGGDWKKISLGAVFALFGLVSKDFDKTNSPNPTVAQNVNSAPINQSSILKVALILLLPIAALSLNGCSLFAKLPSATQAKIGHLAADVGAEAVNLGESWLQNTAANAIEAQTQNGYLDAAAQSLRTTGSTECDRGGYLHAVADATQGANGNTQLPLAWRNNTRRRSPTVRLQIPRRKPSQPA